MNHQMVPGIKLTVSAAKTECRVKVFGSQYLQNLTITQAF